MILLPIVWRTLPNYVPLLAGPAESVILRNHTVGAVEKVASMQMDFFVASTKAIHRDSTTFQNTTPTRSPTMMDCVSTERDLAILPIQTTSRQQQQTSSSPYVIYRVPVTVNKLNIGVEHDSYEYGGARQTVKNGLINHIEFWKNYLSQSELVMSTIEFVYIISFYQDPPSALLKNNKSTLNHAGFVLEAITDLEEKGCIIEVFQKPMANIDL
jgi:hypothetical protein